MRKLKIGIIDLITKGPTRSLYARTMHANLAGIMPQVVGAWCEEMGHDVFYVCYTGYEHLENEMPGQPDIVFISSFTQAALPAYALSNLFRSKGAITVLGGPHARCYPEDAVKYFDYCCGITDKQVVTDILSDCSQYRPAGIYVTAKAQPYVFPSVRERWKFIETTLRKVPLLKIVPMLSSFGCPYQCSFCIDSTVPYHQLDFEVLKEDLRFLLTKLKRPVVGWHDPNFGVRFDPTMDAIEAAIPPDSVDFVAESTLSLLKESHLIRLKKNGFKALLPGIESWFDQGDKSKSGGKQGLEKVRQVSDHINQILSYIPYVQVNFVVGLDTDSGPEPFELTKQFLDWSPAAFPAYSLLTAFGRAAPLNLEYQKEGRLLPFPFHFLNNNHAMNVMPKNYTWTAFYDLLIDVSRHSFSWKAIINRFRTNRSAVPKWLNFIRAVSSEGFGRIRYHSEIRRRLDTDRPLRKYFERETNELPVFYIQKIKKDLGYLWFWLPPGAMFHDPTAYLKSKTLAG